MCKKDEGTNIQRAEQQSVFLTYMKYSFVNLVKYLL
jgi:hypothetical protein